MIYFVDEDIAQLRPYASEMRFRGFEVVSIDNADDAYEALSDPATRIDLIVIDIMLATREKERSRFTRTKTRDFLITGLALIEDLVVSRTDAVPRKVIIFSMATSPDVVGAITSKARSLSIPYLRKEDYPSPFAFGEQIESIIKRLGESES